MAWTASGFFVAKAPETATTVPGWPGKTSSPPATSLICGLRLWRIVSAGSRTVPPSTAPARIACWVASMPIGTIATSALSTLATSQSQYSSTVSGTEPGGCVARRAGLPVAARNALKAAAGAMPSVKYLVSEGAVTTTFSPTAVEATTRMSTPRERATASGATPAT
ncbi:hypothetical protein BTHI11S_06036 [Bosea thiooxidans]